jgi:membrane-associated HD superfamily phosphohydrolase
MQTSDIQAKRNKRLLVALIVLIAATIIAVSMTGKTEYVTVDKNLFKIANTESIDRLTFEHEGKAIELKFNGARWMVNDQFGADGNLIKVIMATLQQAEAKRKVSEGEQDSVSAAIIKDGVKVSAYVGGEVISQFYAGGNSQETQALFKKTSDNSVYVMNIPGYRVYVSGIFELTPSGYREKRVFNFNWRNFQSLEAKFTDNPSQSFTVSPQKGVFGIEGIRTDTTKLGAFMDGIFSLSVDEFVETTGFADSLNRMKPSLELTLRDVAKNEYSLKIYKETPAGQAPGVMHGKDAVLINTQRLRPILRPKSYFVLK